MEKSLRQTRHLSFIAEYSTDIQHVSRESNVVANVLSRPAVPLLHDDEAEVARGLVHDGLVGAVSLCPGLDFSALAQAQ